MLGTKKKLGIEKLLAHRPCRERPLVLAMIADRVLSPRSKFSCSDGLCAATAQNTLAEELQLGDVDVHELYKALDWLLEAQLRIESKLAKKHIDDGSLVLFDVSSSYYEGQESSLHKRGYSRDHRKDRPQIVYGLLCDKDGRPIGVEVFPGERLVVCRNPLLADERARKREELLQATETKLNVIVMVTQREKKPLHGQDKIGVRVGRVIDKYKMSKHFELTITDDSVSYSRRQDHIVAESSLDGLYVIRTSVKADVMDGDTVRSGRSFDSKNDPFIGGGRSRLLCDDQREDQF